MRAIFFLCLKRYPNWKKKNVDVSISNYISEFYFYSQVKYCVTILFHINYVASNIHKINFFSQIYTKKLQYLTVVMNLESYPGPIWYINLHSRLKFWENIFVVQVLKKIIFLYASRDISWYPNGGVPVMARTSLYYKSENFLNAFP